ncbi:MAG: MarR family winged helix-turn-helix transcriptional regulator [Tsuneonella sp.]
MGKQSDITGASELLGLLGPFVDRVAQLLGEDASSAEELQPPVRKREIPEGEAAAIFDRIYRARRAREKVMGRELFADAAWDILLDLAVQEALGKSVSISSICIAAHVPTTTALRYVTEMEKKGLLERRADSMDARRKFIALTDRARAKLKQLAIELEKLGL